MPNYYSEKRYQGPEVIAVAMDIGTTQSAVSFVYFSPGDQPQGKMVAHWPGQAHWSGAAKTPSLVSYRDGVVKACGAETLQDFHEHQEKVAYWFKLHLYPALRSQSNPSEFEIPPLPVGITIERVYADMMKYLMENTRRFFEITTADGAEIWARLRDTIVIVLATPNGWDIREQATLQKAAIMASLVTEENAEQLLQFVTESEASVHYALAQNPGEWLKERTVFAVIDCGGSTVDTTVYRCVSTSPLSLNEAWPSGCVQAGGIFVDREVENMLKKKLKGSPFSDPDIIKSMVDAFENELKPKFDGAMEKYNFRFGVNRDNNPSLGIHKGRITLSNQELKQVFNAVINKIVTSCLDTLINQKAEYVLLVGGFAESPYVRSVLSRMLFNKKIQTITVGDYAKKAAAEGAIIGLIKQFFVVRAAKATFGGCVRQLYDKRLHRERKHTMQVYADGKKRVDDVFHVWIRKGAVLQGTFAHKLSYHVPWDAISTSKAELNRGPGAIEIEVFTWEGDTIPIWCKDEHGVVLKGMRLICTLKADLSSLAGVQMKTGPLGKIFYRVDYNVCIYLRGTQLCAKLQWKERGVLRESPVEVMLIAGEYPPASQTIQPLSKPPESSAYYSPGATMRPPPAATIQRQSQEAFISTPSSSIQRRPDPVSTLKHAVMSEISASNSSPDFLHEQNQSLGPNSTLTARGSVGSTKQALPFDSNSVSVAIAEKNDAEETIKLNISNNDTPLAEGGGVSATLEKLMMDYVPCDLSGQVTIHDRENPAQGSLTAVHFGWFDKREVAVKVLRMRKRGGAEAEWEASNERRITREMHVWSALKHRNICEFLGYSRDFSDYPAMISMWYRHGTAYNYLESQELSVRKRIRLALDVSEGLQHLHDLKIIHGDLKPNNVLIDDACVARLCDFGLVRLVDREIPAGMTMTSPYTGNERYKAPELVGSRDNRPVATFEGDMYSLGSVVLEFIELLHPFERFEGAADLRKAIMEGHYPARRSETTRVLSDKTDLFWDLLETCWGAPSGRPSIKEVIDALQWIAHAMPSTS